MIISSLGCEVVITQRRLSVEFETMLSTRYDDHVGGHVGRVRPAVSDRRVGSPGMHKHYISAYYLTD